MQVIDNARFISMDLLNLLDSYIVKSEFGRTSASEKALRSFTAYCSESEFASESEFGTIVRNWLVCLMLRGNTLSTAVRYLKALSGLYSKAVKEGIAIPNDIFKSLLTILKDKGEELWNNNVTNADFNRLITFTKKAAHNTEEISVDSDMVIISLLNGCMPMIDVAKLKADNVLGLNPDSVEIVERNRQERGRYVFPMNQGNLTPKQLSSKLALFVSMVFAKAGIKSSVIPDEALKSYWAYAALSIGFSPDVIRSCLGVVPAGMKILSLGREIELSDSEKRHIYLETAAIFVNNPMRWYAMHLRARVTYENLIEKLKQIKDTVNVPELFYPCKEIARRIGKKTVFENQPVINSIVYFKTRATFIYPLFLKIGDIAWCYKSDGKNGGSYAAISESSFKRFQETIGCFTPEYAEYFANLEPLKEDDDIVVTGGILDGCSGKVKKIITNSPDGILRYIVEVWKGMESCKIEGRIDRHQVRRKVT